MSIQPGCVEGLGDGVVDRDDEPLPLRVAEALREAEPACDVEGEPLRVAVAGLEKVAEAETERVLLAVMLRENVADAVSEALTEVERETLFVCEDETVSLRDRLPLAVVEALTLRETEGLREPDGIEPLLVAVTEALAAEDSSRDGERLALALRDGEGAPERDWEAERDGEAAVLGVRLALAVLLAVRLGLRLALTVVEAVTLALGSQAQQAAGRVALQLASTTAPPADEPSSARHVPAPVGAGARHHDAFVDWK